MGLGDVKMLALIGAFLGWKALLVALFFAAPRRLGRGPRPDGRSGEGLRTRLPFGTFLALGGLVALFAGAASSASTCGSYDQERAGAALGLRREVLILLPVALLLLVVLSTFTLFSYRNALALLAEERRGGGGRLARADRRPPRRRQPPLAGGAARARPPGPRRRGGGPGGRGPGPAGEIPSAGLLAPSRARTSWRPDPTRPCPTRVAGRAPLEPPRRRPLGAGRPAGRGARRPAARALGVLTVVGARRSTAPCSCWSSPSSATCWRPGRRSSRARARWERQQEPGEEEIEFLLATFERALPRLASRQARRPRTTSRPSSAPSSASLQSGLLLLDREGDVLALQRRRRRLLGVEPPPPGSRSPRPSPASPSCCSLLEPAVADGSAPQRQEIAVQPGGEARTLGLTVHPLRRDDGGIRGCLVLFADLTEVQRQAEESRLAESLARLGEMAGGVAHELRNSLATLRGYLTLIERRPDEESIADYLARDPPRGRPPGAGARGLPRLRPPGHGPHPGAVRSPGSPGAPRPTRRSPGWRCGSTAIRGRRRRLRGDPQLLERARAQPAAQRRPGRARGGPERAGRAGLEARTRRGGARRSRTAARGCRPRCASGSSTPSSPAAAAASAWGSPWPTASSSCTAAGSAWRTGPAAARGRCSSSRVTRSLRSVAIPPLPDLAAGRSVPGRNSHSLNSLSTFPRCSGAVAPALLIAGSP